MVIEIFYLPSYSPDLNPDELLNWDLKAALSLSKTPAAKRNGELEEHAKSHMRSIQKQPEKIKAESVKFRHGSEYGKNARRSQHRSRNRRAFSTGPSGNPLRLRH